MTDHGSVAMYETLARLARGLGPFESPALEADAHRHLLRLTSAAIDLHVERADPARPLPTVWMSPTRKFLGDSPDTVYTTAPVDHAHTYRLTVAPSDALYVGAVVYGRHTPEGPVHVVSSVLDRDLVATDVGFVIDLGAGIDPGDPTALHLDDTAFWVMVREYHGDPAAAVGGRVAIERTDGSTHDGPPAPTVLTDGFEAAASWVERQLSADVAIDGLMAYPSGSKVDQGPAPEVPDDLVSVFFPTPDISYQGCRFAMDETEMLEVSFVAPPCRFWSVSVMTPWLESVEHQEVRASVNSENAVIETDGSVVVRISESDPGHPNWIPRRGYERGQVAYRVLLSESEPSEARFVMSS